MRINFRLLPFAIALVPLTNVHAQALLGTDTAVGLSIQTNSSTAIVVDTSQRVSIGTAAPTAALHLKAGTTTAGTAPLKFTSGTNLTTPEDGAIEYDGSKLTFTDSSANRRAVSIGGIIVKSADESIANNTLQSDNHFTFEAVANTSYYIDMTLHVSSTDTGPDIKYGFQLPSGTFTLFGGNFAANATTVDTASASNTTANLNLTNNANIVILLRGTVDIGGTGGTVIFRWAQNTTNAGDPVTINSGSIMKYEAI